jgi:hypothetical protein
MTTHQALFEIKGLEGEYRDLANDLILLASILIIAMLVYSSAGSSGLVPRFPEILISLMMGLAFYAMVIKKLLVFN